MATLRPRTLLRSEHIWLEWGTRLSLPVDRADVTEAKIFGCIVIGADLVGRMSICFRRARIDTASQTEALPLMRRIGYKIPWFLRTYGLGKGLAETSNKQAK